MCLGAVRVKRRTPGRSAGGELGTAAHLRGYGNAPQGVPVSRVAVRFAPDRNIAQKINRGRTAKCLPRDIEPQWLGIKSDADCVGATLMPPR